MKPADLKAIYEKKTNIANYLLKQTLEGIEQQINKL